MRWAALTALALATLFVAVAGCSSNAGVLLQTASSTTDGPPAEPDILGPFEGDPAVNSAEAWRNRRAPLLRDAFERHVYGPLPMNGRYERTARSVVKPDAYDGLGQLETWTLTPVANGEGPEFTVAAVIPNTAQDPAPVIVMQQFCGVRSALREESDALPDDLATGGCPDSLIFGVVGPAIFGKYIDGPPWKDLLERGYAGVVLYPSDVVPDNGSTAPDALRGMPAAADRDAPNGAVASWAWAFSRIVDVLDADPRFNNEQTVLWGHSRFGKAALVSAAYDDRADAIIAHQSGTGGATLSRNPDGESVAAITESYPHWFTPAFSQYAGNEDALPVDQHQLLALIAPRPVLLGNARRDVWSGPESSFRAAQGADPIYELLGADGLEQDTLTRLNLAAEIGFYSRPGRHGVTTRDWDTFLDWLDQQLSRNTES